MAKQEQKEQNVVKAVGPRPFATLKATAFVDVVKDLTSCLQKIDPVGADFVLTRRSSSSLASMGFTHWSHLEGVNYESLNIKNPVQSALLTKAVMTASHNARTWQETNYNCGASVLCSSTSPLVAILSGHSNPSQHLGCKWNSVEYLASA